VIIAAPFEPDCNLMCLAVNPRGNRSLRVANAFARRLYDAIAVRPERPVQLNEFYGSCTTVPLTHLGREELSRTGEALGLDLAPADDEGLFLLRHTLMNPWLQASPGPGEPSYVEAYLHYLGATVKRLLAEPVAPAT
jgi:hypothetical protein